MKKFLSILLAAMMLFAMVGTAFADGETTSFTITVTNTNPNLSIAGNTYSAYQLFAATVSESGAVQYGDGDLNVEYNGYSGNELLVYLDTLEDHSAEIRDFADFVYEKYIKDQSVTAAATKTADAGSQSVSLTMAEAGYYLVFGTGSAADGNAAVASLVLLNPVTSTTPVVINPKFDAPNLDKEIYHNEETTWGDVGDNKIGDAVHYRIKTSVPNKTENFDSYEYVIHDTMTAGLTFNNDLVIYTSETEAEENKLDSKYYKTTTTANGFDVDVDVKQAIADGKLTAGSYIWSYYTCTLNENALIYDEGSNDNTAYLEYSTNPYVDEEGKEETGETEEVTVYDYTFHYDVIKVDTAGTELTGARFVLSTNDKLGDLSLNAANEVVNSSNVVVEDLIKFNFDATANAYVINSDTTDASASPVIGTDTTSSYHIDGLDDSVVYYLYEVKTPGASYNKLTSPVAIQITAEYEKDSTGKDVLKADSPKSNGKESLEISVVNQIGASLPSTGGIGTTLFYLFGSIMAAGSALILVVRRRAEAEEE